MHNKENLLAEATEIKMIAWYNIFQLKNQTFLTITHIHTFIHNQCTYRIP